MNSKLSSDPRFAVLHHQPGDGPSRTKETHLDWMFETGQLLRTWSTPLCDLATAETSIEIDCDPLADHRLDYLDFEGEVSSGRGTVSRVLAGTYQLIEGNSDRFHVLLLWADARCTGKAKVEIYRSSRPAVGERFDESRGAWRLRFSPGR